MTPGLDATVVAPGFGCYIRGIRAGIGSLRIRIRSIKSSVMNVSMWIRVFCMNRMVESHDQFAQSPRIGSFGHRSDIRNRFACI